LFFIPPNYFLKITKTISKQTTQNTRNRILLGVRLFIAKPLPLGAFVLPMWVRQVKILETLPPIKTNTHNYI